MNSLPLLTLLTLTPLVGAAVIAGLDPKHRSLARGLGLFFNLIAFGLAATLWANFNARSGDLQFVERHDWIPSVGVQYFLGIDGMGLLMVLLTSLIVPFGLLASWRVEENTRGFVSLLLFLQAGLFGAFTALNFIHWFAFYELTLAAL